MPTESMARNHHSGHKYELSHEKTKVLHMQKQKAVTTKLISAFVFTTGIVQFLNFLNPKFAAFSHLLWLHSPICVNPVWKPHCLFSHDAAHMFVKE